MVKLWEGSVGTHKEGPRDLGILASLAVEIWDGDVPIRRRGVGAGLEDEHLESRQTQPSRQRGDARTTSDDNVVVAGKGNIWSLVIGRVLVPPSGQSVFAPWMRGRGDADGYFNEDKNRIR